jgi:hypothetical protein
MLNSQTNNGKQMKTASPEILCKIEETPIIGRFIVSKFKFTGRLSFSITFLVEIAFVSAFKALSL